MQRIGGLFGRCSLLLLTALPLLPTVQAEERDETAAAEEQAEMASAAAEPAEAVAPDAATEQAEAEELSELPEAVADAAAAESEPVEELAETVPAAALPEAAVADAASEQAAVAELPEAVAEAVAAESEPVEEPPEELMWAAPAEETAEAPEVPASAGEEGVPAVSDLLLLYQQAQQQDPRVLVAQAAERRAQYQQREALGRLLPQMSADVRLTRTNYISESSETYYGGERYSASITQVLYDLPAWQSFQRSRALSQQYEAQGEVDVQGATADLVQRYFDVLAAQDSLELIQAEKRVVERNLERINSLYERQLASITEKLEVVARLDRLKSDEIEAENRIWVAREGLGEVLGRPVYEPLERLSPQPNLDSIELKNHDHWRDAALARNPLIRARQAALEAQRRAHKEARGEHMPRVSLQLASQKSNIGYENAASGRTESNVAAVNIQLPLFSGGSTLARSDAAHESILIAEQELKQAQREVLREVRTAFLNSKSYRARIEATRVALDSAVKAREAAEKSFSFGINNVVDVLDRVREQYSAQRDLLEARYGFLLSYIVLKRWCGMLDEQDVRLVNELLEAYSSDFTALTAG